MIVACKMHQCPYYFKGFCAKKTVVTIDEMGMCNVLWKKGQQRMLQTPFSETLYPKENVIIVEAGNDFREIKQTKVDECGGSRQEDLRNGDAAQQKTEKKNDEELGVQKSDEVEHEKNNG